MPDNNLELEIKDTKGKRTKLLLIAVVAAILLLLGAVGAWFMLSGNNNQPAADYPLYDPADYNSSEDLFDINSIYVNFPQAFLFNAQHEQGSYVVQIHVHLQVRTTEAQETLNLHMPLVRDVLLTTFSTADGRKLRTGEGKIELRQRALQNLQNAMINMTGHPQVDRVLFTGFVMQ